MSSWSVKAAKKSHAEKRVGKLDVAWARRLCVLTVVTSAGAILLTASSSPGSLVFALHSTLFVLGMTGLFFVRGMLGRSQTLLEELEEIRISAEDRNTELARVNSQLVVAANRFESLFQRLPVACLGYDCDGILREWNSDAQRMFGFYAHEVYDQPIWTIIRSADHSLDDHQVLLDIFATGQPIQGFECVLLNREGAEVHAVCSIVPILGPDGNVCSAISSYVDVTEIAKAKAEAARERDFNDAVLGTAGCLVCVADREGRLVRFNAECERVTGWKAEDFQDASFLDILILESEKKLVLEFFHSALNGVFPNTVEHHWKTRDGNARLINFTTTSLFDANGQVEFIIGTGIDVTERRLLESKLAETNGIRGAILESAQYSIIATDVKGVILTFNRAAEQMLGYQAEEVVGRHTPLIVHKADEVAERAAELNVPPGFEVIAACAADKPIELEWTYVGKDSQNLPVLLSVSALKAEDERITGYLCVAQDIRDRKAAELQISQQMDTISTYANQLEAQTKQLEAVNKRLERLAATDGLTGLKNHRTFKEQLLSHYQLARRNNMPLSLVLIDVDRFKHFNDTYGHQAGDDVLRTVGRILDETARTTDVVARYGGEEFVLILPGSDKNSAIEAAERFRSALEVAPWTYRLVTASFGVSTLQPATESPDHLIKLADQALYQSKARGRNCVSHCLDEHPVPEDL